MEPDVCDYREPKLFNPLIQTFSSDPVFACYDNSNPTGSYKKQESKQRELKIS